MDGAPTVFMFLLFRVSPWALWRGGDFEPFPYLKPPSPLCTVFSFRRREEGSFISVRRVLSVSAKTQRSRLTARVSVDVRFSQCD
ncbi:expressed unknown protein [Ectocarpus siliculosus]|uniref:Secreted protein n=1 Tax=Ectocarpus siliculosus TaxID=2880 RepID=D8LBV3_ECTSI|nr:expressed unknown protein [Ectocarpus siliculosus]|eukprot:CBN76812.1 expressed unknown protein [Ectocarpus siliculosus]